MDVISLSSESSESGHAPVLRSQNEEIIVLTDEVDLEDFMAANEREQREQPKQFTVPESPIVPVNPTEPVNIKPVGGSSHVYSSSQTQPENLLDLENWMSSVDESFNVSIPLTPKRKVSGAADGVRNPSTKPLPSSPITAVSRFDLGFESSYKEGSEAVPSILSIFEEEIAIPKEAPSTTATSIKGVKLARTNHRSCMTSDPIESSSPPQAPPPKKARKSKATKDTEVNERATKAWRNANKVVRKKQDIMSEMVIEISLCLQKRIETDYFKSVFVLPKVRSSYLALPLITWKRRVTAKYNKEEDIFEPCELTEVSEKVLLLFYDAEELVQKLKEGVIEEDIEKAKRKARVEDPLKDHFVLIMVVSFSDYLRKLQSKEDKQYRARTLQQLHRTQSSLSSSEETTISAKEASRLLIESEVRLGVNIFATKSVDESIDWLHSFTYTIGSSMYDKYERNSEFANIGTSRSGADAKGTFLEMVKKFNLMTAPRAESLYQYHPSPLSLYRRLLGHPDLGAVNGKNIVPPSVSKAMRNVFTSRDPNAVITD